jgi:hypothetical protein
MKKINPKKIINNVEKAKFKYNNVTGTFRNELGQEKSAIEANNFNEKIEAQKSRRRDYYSKLWDVELDPKKMHKQDLKNNMRKWVRQADEERYKSLKSLKPKKPILKVDVPSISEGISKYIYLTKRKENIQPPENFGKKFRDPDMEKGIGSLNKKFI